jgi:hypothetical protein
MNAIFIYSMYDYSIFEMGNTVDKVHEKSNDVKDKVGKTSKDIGDTANDTASSSPSAFSIGQEKKYEGNGSNAEIGKIEDALTEYPKEEPITLANIKENETATTATNPTTNTNTHAAGSVHKSNRQYSFNENNEFSNPFMMGLKMWQSYSTMWMDFYNQMLNYTARMTKDFESTKEKNKSNGTDPKGFKVKVE